MKAWPFVSTFLMTLVIVVLLSAGAQTGGAGPQSSPILVELFTSEGCSSCPPADALLARLEQEQWFDSAEIIVLSEHVDYWDRLGWRDPFSSHQFSERQKRYAKALGSDLYTPMMVVDGQRVFIGNYADRARAAIARSVGEPKVEIGLGARSEDGKVTAWIKIGSPIPEWVSADRLNLLLAIREDDLSVDVERGENHGKTLTHRGVVRLMEQAEEFDAKNIRDHTTDVEVGIEPEWNVRNLAVVAILEDAGTGRVYGVAKQPVD